MKKSMPKRRLTQTSPLGKIFTESNVVFFTQDVNLCYTSVSDPSFNFSNTQYILGKNDSEVLGKENGAILEKIKRKVLSTKFGREDEVALTLNSSLFYFDLRTHPIFGAGRKVTGISSSLTNITRLKNVEDYLRREQDFVKKILGMVPDLIMIFDLEKKKPLFVNKNLKKLGYSIGQLRSLSRKNVIGIVHPNDLRRFIEFEKELMQAEEGEVREIELRVKTPGNQYKWILARSSIFSKKNLKPTQILSVVEDIQHHKELEQEIKERDEWLLTIVDNSASAIFAKDLKGQYILFNRKCEEVFNLRREDVLGRTDKEIFPEKLANIYMANDKKVLKFGKTIQVEEESEIDGESAVFLSVKFPIFDSHGSVKAVCGISTDITEIKELETRKDNFISMASHELKTPITSIKVFNQILRKLPQYEVASKYLRMMDDQIEKLTILVNDLLDVSKIQVGRLALRKTFFNLNKLLMDSIEVMQATTAKHQIILSDNPNLRIFADKERISQVISNLLSNAIKYSPKGGKIVVTVDKQKEKIKVSVIDCGVGVPKQYQEKIFNRFFRVYKEQDKTFPGLGMGLYISYEIIKRHEGDMWVESVKGKGSNFNFTLPYE